MLYPKINSVFKRDPDTKFKTFLPEYSEPEFGALAFVEWEVTEKIDGMNMRVEFDGLDGVTFGGRSERADIPRNLQAYMEEHFPRRRITECFKDPGAVTLFGEGYGAGIQRGGHYREDQAFILFDILVDGDWWLHRTSLEEIAAHFEVPIVPLLGNWQIYQADSFVRDTPQSKISDQVMEGVILKAPLGLKTRAGKRIITKLKVKDYASSGSHV